MFRSARREGLAEFDDLLRESVDERKQRRTQTVGVDLISGEIQLVGTFQRSVPDSAIARWIKTAEKVVLIDGCFLRCHGRIIENLIDEEKLVQFDALSHYNRYTDIFDYEDVPDKERKEVAQSVADWVLGSLENIPAEGSADPVQTEGQCGAGCG